MQRILATYSQRARTHTRSRRMCAERDEPGNPLHVLLQLPDLVTCRSCPTANPVRSTHHERQGRHDWNARKIDEAAELTFSKVIE